MSGAEYGILIASITSSLIAIIGAVFAGLKVLAEVRLSREQLKSAAVALAAKTDAAAAVIHVKTDRLQDSLDRNTEITKANVELTRSVGDRADAAYKEANDINRKIEAVAKDKAGALSRIEDATVDTNTKVSKLTG